MDRQEDINIRISSDINKLNETIRTCRLVEETLDTKGWTEVVEPLLDKMINDLLGSKVNGKWNGGILDRARKDEKREFYIGYKQALIDLHTRIYAYKNNIKILENKKDSLIDAATLKYTVPMKDTRYGKD